MTTPSTGDSEVKSALHASLELKKDQSYYYAHQPRKTTEAPAPLPVHQALRKEKHTLETPIVSVSCYQFLDSDKFAKVFVPLENLSAVSDDAITADFKQQSFTVSIRDCKPNAILRLFVDNLEGDIVPDECRVKKLESKIVVYLAKAANEDGKCFPWRNLKKK